MLNFNEYWELYATYNNISIKYKLTEILFIRNEILAPGLEGGVEQFAFSISPTSYFTFSVHKVGGACGSSVKIKIKKNIKFIYNMFNWLYLYFILIYFIQFETI